MLVAAQLLQFRVHLSELVWTDLVHVSEKVAGPDPVPVAAMWRGEHVHRAGEIDAVGLDDVEVVAGDVDLDGERPEADQAARGGEVLAYALLLLEREGEHGGQPGDHVVAALPAEVGNEDDVVARPRIDEHLAGAVEHQAAVGGDAQLLHEVLVGPPLELLAPEDLQVVEAREEHQEGQAGDPRHPEDAAATVAARRGRAQRHGAPPFTAGSPAGRDGPGRGPGRAPSGWPVRQAP